MSIADTARSNAIPLEVKKDGLSQKQSGDWTLRFTVSALDMDERLTRAPMGTRFMAALVEINDDETPVEQPQAPTTQPTTDKPRMEWRELSPAVQSGIRCHEPVFWAFLREDCNRPEVTGEQAAATAVRKICGVNSRASFSTNRVAAGEWSRLDGQFQAWKQAEAMA